MTLPALALLRARLRFSITDCAARGLVTDGLTAGLDALPDSYDALDAFAARLDELPMRDDWPYVEPDDLAGIWAEADPGRPLGALVDLAPEDAAARVGAAFTGSVCGCMLGKPLEFDPTFAEIEAALSPRGRMAAAATTCRRRW